MIQGLLGTTLVPILARMLLVPASATAPFDSPVDFSTQGAIDAWTDGGVVDATETPTGLAAEFVDETSQTGVVLELDGLQSRGTIDGFAAAVDPVTETAAFLRSSPAGGQVVFTAETSEGLDDFIVETHQPIIDQGELPDAGTALTFGDGTGILLEEPWAFDAAGVALETEYEVIGNTIRQIVDADGAQFPVIADPAWTYLFDHLLSQKTPPQVQSLLPAPGGFSRFPVENAPSNFPAVDQFLPLVVNGMNVNCIMNGVHQGVDEFERWWGFSFRAAPSHVDGAGSSIRFTFMQSLLTGETKLYVYAVIQNTEPGGIPQDAYRFGASASWLIFARNVDLA